MCFVFFSGLWFYLFFFKSILCVGVTHTFVFFFVVVVVVYNDCVIYRH